MQHPAILLSVSAQDLLHSSIFSYDRPFTWTDDEGNKRTRPAYDYRTVEWLETFNR